MAIKTYNRKPDMNISKNFKLSEFACRCGKCSTVKIDDKLVEYLQKIRDHFGKPVRISAYRCETWNTAVGGVKGSYHMLGQAADVTVTGVAPAEVAKYAESIGILGIGLYETAKDDFFVHIDTRTFKSFWYGQAQAYRSTFGGAPAKPATPAAPTTPVKTYAMKLPLLQKGMISETVKSFQQLLIAKGYSCGPDGADGNFGGNTEQAVLKYQREKKLGVDGKVGPEVWTSILSL